MFFDQRDYKLIDIVNSVYNEPNALGYTGKLFYSYFHPLGIKELAESKGLRTAYSIVNLLESMERGEISTRLAALAGLKDDIIDTADGPMPKNTARVLLQIMKDLVRAKNDPENQLQLAHDFRMAAFGKPRIIRSYLQRYHLLEMPEEWNQITFDDHVHDANTSGRKWPTHLIMDAWIKGIRRLRVIYYHYIEPRFALELIEAAKIMEIDLRIGIEFWALHRGRYISFIWVSRGLPDPESFLCFLSQPRVTDFMAEGKAVLQCQEQFVRHLLGEFNRTGRNVLNQDLDVSLPLLEEGGYLNFVAPGQATLENLGEWIHSRVVQTMDARISDLQNAPPSTETEKRIEELTHTKTHFTVRDILSSYLGADQFFDRFKTYVNTEIQDRPDRLRTSVTELLDRVDELHHDYRITLNLDRLKPEDVLELLYKSRGRINRIEIINLKKFKTADTEDILCVNALQKAINQGSLLKLKRIILKIIARVEALPPDRKEDRMDVLLAILHDINELKFMYGTRPIKLRIGSDSAGKPHQVYGMGFAVVDTLAGSAKRRVRKDRGQRLLLPVNIRTNLRMTILPHERIPRFLQRIPGLSRKKTDWDIGPYTLANPDRRNLVTLGKSAHAKGKPKVPKRPRPVRCWSNLNSRLKNTLKILIGFIPAQICFMLTKDWWVLAFLGAPIWFGITSIRNILQSVFGSGGMKRAARLKWNDYVSWDRLADSLLFTGFSVPLLDWAVKTLLLERHFGITTANGPVILYSVMGLANGIYLSSHNFFRGLPKGAVTGNFFRSILAIPVAVLINSAVGGILGGFGVMEVNAVLQKWAAIISKTASDIVAGIIEGAADRLQNTRRRKRDIHKKIQDLYQTYSKLAMLFPETQEMQILKDPVTLLTHKNSEVRDLVTLIIINALDLFYFWMYLPRARAVMMDMVAEMTPEENTIFIQSQEMLRHEQYISRLFVDGILGRHFSKALSFYLTSYPYYLKGITEEKMKRSKPHSWTHSTLQTDSK